MDQKPLNDWTIEEFKQLPFANGGWNAEFLVDALIILPMDEIHDSGYRCLDFIGVVGDRPIARLSGCSDVVHIDGIGGFGDNWLEGFGKVPSAIHPRGWNIDCLKTSGLLRLFLHSYKIKVGLAMSSFEIFAVPRREELARRERFEKKENAE